MKNIWLNISDSFEAAERFDKHYYQRMPAAVRLETVQFLREMHYTLAVGGTTYRPGILGCKSGAKGAIQQPKYKLKPPCGGAHLNGGLNGSRKRLRRVIKIIQ